MFNLVYDTWAKIPSGLLYGNRQNPGHFTECVLFRHEAIQGQHCMISITATGNETLENIDGDHFNWREIGSLSRDYGLNFVHGMCLPASCSIGKVLEYANIILNKSDLKGTKAICRTNDPVKAIPLDYFAL